jgi:hypothetical protein
MKMSDFNIGDKVYLECEVRNKDMSDNKYTLKYKNWCGDEKITYHVANDVLHTTDESYNKGLNDAWELAKKIEISSYDGGYTGKELMEMFGTISFNKIFADLTPQEALTKVKQYEERNEIKKGDVVNDSVGETLVLRIDDGRIYLLCRDGSCGEYPLSPRFKKTGKHFDSIDEFMRSTDD